MASRATPISKSRTAVKATPAASTRRAPVTLRHLAGVVCLYLAIQACWFLAIPAFEGPDEIQHYDHARYVAVNGHLPDRVPARVNEGDWFTGEWTQESAYYWMFGWILRPTGFQDVRPGDTLVQSRHSIWSGGNSPTVFAHGTPLPAPVVNGMLVGRVLSVLFGLGTLLAVFAAIRACTHDDRIATLAAGCVALVPQFGAQHIFITNDTPAAMWASIAATLVAVLLARPASASGWQPVRDWRLGAAIGVATGLAIATKLTAGMIVVAMPLALWAQRRDSWRPQAIAWIAGLLATAGVAFGRNWIVFGDPLATALKHAVVSQFQFRIVFKPGELASYVDLAQMLFRGIWASIGWAAWMPDTLWLRVLFAALTVVLLACFGTAAWLALRGRSATLTVMLTVFVLHAAAFLVSISLVAGYSARYFLPMIVPFIVITLLGARKLLALLRERIGADPVRWAITGMMLTLAIVWIGTFSAVLAAFHFERALR
jgi:4-amino-4-deoxy-L-arabinose transferase-like glycosyltransferase